ncbi:hypothetical protein [Streptomyces adelaidensis]|uniref:hypothetical protein n=1 Tax=Streptomyces adelaidensis TaxID=2796465 RepID=UPI00190621EE|nr:hypothetical protein [Streptomyces adelaidensis]
MNRQTSDEGTGGGAGKGRKTRPWAELRGPSAEADELAVLLRTWLDDAGLRLDDLRGKLTPEHFKGKTVPARTTVADRLAGVNLGWDFVEAVADVCSRDRAHRERLTKGARPLFEAADRVKRTGTAPRTRTRTTASSRAATDAAMAAQLIGTQRQSLELSNELLRAVQRNAELEKARNDANHMVLILLTLVDKLQRDINTLTAQRAREGAVRTPGRDALDEAHRMLHDNLRDKLRHSEAQRTQAETELARARAEREKTDRLAEQSAEQVHRLTEELALLRRVHAHPAAEDDAPETAVAEVSTAAPDIEADDIDLALMKAARFLDNRAERLEQLQEELRDEPDGLSGPDNPMTSEAGSDDSADNSAAEADNSPDNSPDECLDDGPDNSPDDGSAFLLPGTPWYDPEAETTDFLQAIHSLRQAGDSVRASHLLFRAGADGSEEFIVRLLRRLWMDDVHVVVAGIGAERWIEPFRRLVGRLRAAGLSAMAAMALMEAGRLRGVDLLPSLLAPLPTGSADSVLMLRGVGLRPKEQVEAVMQELEWTGQQREAHFLSVTVAGILRGSGRASWFGSAPSPRTPPPYEPEPPRTTPVLTTRVRINIPGSRPQPPMVLRTPLPPAENDGPARGA